MIDLLKAERFSASFQKTGLHWRSSTKVKEGTFLGSAGADNIWMNGGPARRHPFHADRFQGTSVYANNSTHRRNMRGGPLFHPLLQISSGDAAFPRTEYPKAYDFRNGSKARK